MLTHATCTPCCSTFTSSGSSQAQTVSSGQLNMSMLQVFVHQKSVTFLSNGGRLLHATRSLVWPTGVSLMVSQLQLFWSQLPLSFSHAFWHHQSVMLPGNLLLHLIRSPGSRRPKRSSRESSRRSPL